jgi:hypothetical protein
MKKTLLTSLCVVAVSAVSFGQGYVNWSTIVPTYMSAQTNSTVYSSFDPNVPGTANANGTQGNTAASTTLTYYWVLLYAPQGTAAPTTVSQLSSWASTGLYADNPASHNLTPLSVSSPSSGSGTLTQLPWANGATEEVLMAGWSANIAGASWSTVLTDLQTWNSASASIVGTAFFGVSNEGQYNPAAASPGTTPFGTVASGLINAPNMQLDALSAVPEPGTMALAAIGGASLLLFRRKK